MAYNLALTIKATGSTIPVALVYDKPAVAHLNEDQLKMFDHLILSDWDWNKIRFNIDRISPFDLTLQLDADMLWLWKDPDILFEQYKDVELLVTNEGYYEIETGEEKLTGNYGWLADRDQTVKLYKLKGKLYQMRWELLLFKKTDNVRKMFVKAEAIRKNPKLKTWIFEGQPVDEFAFYVAANIYNLDQVETPFYAAYWCRRTTKNPRVGELNKTFHAVGFGGNTANYYYREMYDTIMEIACRKLGLPYTFKLQSKRDHLTSRIAV